MNILIKLTCLIGLVIAPILGEMYGNGHQTFNEKVVDVVENVEKTQEGESWEGSITVNKN
jgi:K(+)-stimulated pyrophosphate-energized sodium pump